MSEVFLASVEEAGYLGDISLIDSDAFARRLAVGLIPKDREIAHRTIDARAENQKPRFPSDGRSCNTSS